MNRYPEWKLDWAHAVMELRDSGVFDPSCKEIARQVHKRKSVPPDLINTIRQNLRAIQTIVRVVHGIELIHTVAEEYYCKPSDREQSFRELPPQNDAECALCSPLGHKKRRYGLRFAGKKDKLWLHMNQHHRKSSSASTQHGLERLVIGKQASSVALKLARKEAKGTIDAVLPPNLGVLGHLGNGENDESEE